jgi:hypothetical protein
VNSHNIPLLYRLTENGALFYFADEWLPRAAQRFLACEAQVF